MSNKKNFVIILLGEDMKKTKLKLKKNVWIFLGGIAFLALIIFIGIQFYHNAQYKKTNVYKLLEAGYQKEEIKLLEQKLDEEEITDIAQKEKDEFLIEILKDDYFIQNNLDRYIHYHNENEGKSARQVVSFVNTNNDYEYYTHDLDTDVNQDYLMLVNKYYHLNSSYEPDDLVNINNKYYYGEGHKIRKIAYDAFIDMWNQANQAGIYLIINSSYRTFQEQQKVYDGYKDSQGTTYADSIAARPGYSEHQTGLSLDIFSKENTTTSNFKDSPAYNWLTENAHKYGFIQRYQKDTEDITGFKEEAWHWRYVGVDAATYIYEHNITFDEYYAYFILNK